MISPRKLAAYDDDEGTLVLSQCAVAISRGHIELPSDLYPDLPVVKCTAYTRTPLPLSFLVFLYDRTIIFVPPASREDLEQRWGMSFEAVVTLARAGILQPIIRQAVDYGAPHFEPLLETRPPALFSRGVSLLDRLGLGNTLVENECPLPVSDIARLPALRRKYQTYYPQLTSEELTERIKREVLVNYADLWIFGEGELADSLQHFKDAHEIAQRLFLANEVRTYPTLFGMGGTANYDREFLSSESSIFAGLDFARNKKEARIIPDSLPLLLTGLNINVREVGAETVIQFHQSGYGEKLRNAMSYFESKAHKVNKVKGESLTRQELLDVASDLQRIITAAAKELSSPQFARQARRLENATRLTLRVGSPALGGWLGHVVGASILEGIGGASILEQLIVEPKKDKIVDAVLSARFNPGLANLWRIVAG